MLLVTRVLFVHLVKIPPLLAAVPHGISQVPALLPQTAAVMPGAFMKGTFMGMLAWVKTGAYKTETRFQKYFNDIVGRLVLKSSSWRRAAFCLCTGQPSAGAMVGGRK